MSPTKIKMVAIIILLLTIGEIKAQEYDYYETEKDKKEINLKEKLKFNVELGFGMSSRGNYGQYVTPYASWQLSPKLSLQTGTSFGNMPYYNFYNNTKTLNSSFFVSGIYQMNDKLSLYGSAFVMNQNRSLLKRNTENLPQANSAIKSMSFGINYSITPNMEIGIEFRTIENRGISPR